MFSASSKRRWKNAVFKFYAYGLLYAFEYNAKISTVVTGDADLDYVW